MAAHGIAFGAPQVDLAKLRDWKNKVVGKLTGGLDVLAKQRKVTRRARQRRVSRRRTTIEVERDGGAQTIALRPVHHRGRLASRSRCRSCRDDPRIIDSTGALELPSCPSGCS